MDVGVGERERLVACASLYVSGLGWSEHEMCTIPCVRLLCRRRPSKCFRADVGAELEFSGVQLD